MKLNNWVKTMAITAMVASSMAQARTVTLRATGKGGTSTNDTSLACDNAERRAENAVERSCDNRDGYIRHISFSNCDCDRDHNPNNDSRWICETTARAECEY